MCKAQANQAYDIAHDYYIRYVAFSVLCQVFLILVRYYNVPMRLHVHYDDEERLGYPSRWLVSDRSLLSLLHLPYSRPILRRWTPTDITDRLSTSFPHFMSIELGRRSTDRIAELDKFVKKVSSLQWLSLQPCIEIF